MPDPTFRPARPEEGPLLNEMTLAGVRHWGHDQNFPDAYQDLASMLETHDISNSTIFAIEGNGEIVAFYELVNRDDHVELLRMFQSPKRIGTGMGRMMWEHCTVEAAKSADRMLIMSDPSATGFYSKMGATLEDTVEVSPGFELGVFWLDLASHR